MNLVTLPTFTCLRAGELQPEVKKLPDFQDIFAQDNTCKPLQRQPQIYLCNLRAEFQQDFPPASPCFKAERFFPDARKHTSELHVQSQAVTLQRAFSFLLPNKRGRCRD